MARSRATDSDSLLTAAAAVFETKGYRNATIDDIAEAAGVSRPTVYKYTQSKRALLDGMVDTVLDRVATRLGEVLASAAPPADKVRAIVDIHVDSATHMHAFYAILFSEQAELSDATRARFHAFSHDVAKDFQALLDECVAAARLTRPPVDTWIAANLALSMLTSLYRWYDPRGATSPEELREQVMLLLAGVVPRSTRRAGSGSVDRARPVRPEAGP